MPKKNLTGNFTSDWHEYQVADLDTDEVIATVQFHSGISRDEKERICFDFMWNMAGKTPFSHFIKRILVCVGTVGAIGLIALSIL